ncbi:hypothetical protein PLICRDRAFT_358175 [Plicaturopsis crispa FD-325 SS-3]|uniref:Uncharacterized protein n=1 Tax=Plicaturopsis crispa FD-325 SS-3 TaxID=944288 RepID=A0A0C9SXB8_PLICR|nr:hypothetical protein PLICRDRAFT_358175 [Plicaturopsis crispa FD-325 SS-3]
MTTLSRVGARNTSVPLTVEMAEVLRNSMHPKPEGYAGTLFTGPEPRGVSLAEDSKTRGRPKCGMFLCLPVIPPIFILEPLIYTRFMSLILSVKSSFCCADEAGTEYSRAPSLETMCTEALVSHDRSLSRYRCLSTGFP